MGALGMSQPRVSLQLAVLKRAELVTSHRTGNWFYYKINTKLTNNDLVTTMLTLIPKWLSGDKLVESDRLALRACLKQQEKTGMCDLESFQGIREKVSG
jgi:DNA-binding transcriptional ArsR family regulator